ncbi:unnamed protein product [Symbiodinium pilosum]|uniref:Uncharacterized protein n=1 Tax=Symbiodinium pilosum TaxID=2952 RepID=A0A812V8V5_SYMPI|nr:unnamed protein product [Symbiodinium pilosum]
MSEEVHARRTEDRVKVLEEKVDRMRQDFEYGPAVQAAFQAGESAGAEAEPHFLPRKGFGMLQFQRSSTGLTDDCIEALVANLTALDGLGAGDLARRLNRAEERLEALAVSVAQAVQLSREGLELLRYVLSGERPESRLPADTTSQPSQPSQDVQQSVPPTPTAFLPKYLSDPPTALTAVMEEATASTGSYRRRPQSAASAVTGDESIAAPDLDPDAGVKFIEVSLQRSAAQPSWGLLWDRKCFDKKRRVVEAVVPQSPAGMWNQERAEKGEDFLQRGDELIKLNGKLGWEACSDLTNQQNVQLLFKRSAEQDRSGKGRRSSKQAPRPTAPAEAVSSLTETQRMRVSAEARGKSRQSLSSASSPSKATGTGGSLNSMPHTPSTGASPASPEQLPLQRCASPPVKSQDSDPQNTIQVLQAALAGGGGGHAVPKDLHVDLQAHAPSSEKLQGVNPIMATIMAHSRSVRAADPGKASLINPPADDLQRLAGHLLAGEAGPAMTLVMSILQKSVQGPDGRVTLVAADQTEAAQYLLDLLKLLDSQQTAPRAK